jgi:hypothetical protein
MIPPSRRPRTAASELAVCALVVAGLALPTPSAEAKDPSEITARDKETARNLLDQGDKLFEADDVAGALQKYRAADEIMGVPTTAVEVGRALETLGRLVEARDAYLRVMRYPKRDDEGAAFARARARADERARDLAPRIPKLTLVLEGAEGVTPVVAIDGVAVSPALLGQPMSVDPGERRIEIAAPGRIPLEKTLTLGEGDAERVVLTLAIDPNAKTPPPSPVPAPTLPPLPQPPHEKGGSVPVFATIGFTLGAAGLVVGGVTGGLSLAKTADLDEACGGDTVCPLGTQAAIDEAELLANVSNVGFAVAGVGLIFGIVALFTLDADDGNETAAVTPLVGPGSLGLRGRF